jgi:hypothetical protein
VAQAPKEVDSQIPLRRPKQGRETGGCGHQSDVSVRQRPSPAWEPALCRCHTGHGEELYSSNDSSTRARLPSQRTNEMGKGS